MISEQNTRKKLGQYIFKQNTPKKKLQKYFSFAQEKIIGHKKFANG